MEFLRKLWSDEEGQGMVEYGLIIALVSIVIILALTAIGTNLNTVFTDISTKLKGLNWVLEFKADNPW